MTNKLKLDFDDAEIKYASKLIRKYKKCYTQSKSLDEALSVLKDLSSNYKFFNNNAVVFLTGSYARMSIKESSDLDLNVVYLRGRGLKYTKYEELFFYVVCRIFGFKRRQVHPVLITFNDIDNTNLLSKTMDSNDYCVNLQYNNGCIKYSVPANSKKRMFLQYGNNKNYVRVFNNLLKMSDEIGYREWMFNCLMLNNNKRFQKYLQNYYKKLLEDIDSQKYNKLKEYILSLIDSRIIDCDQALSCDIKKIYHCNQLQIIYNFLLLQQIQNNKTNVTMNFDKLKSEGCFDTIIDYYQQYIKLLNELQLEFEKCGFEYSLHSKQLIVLENFSTIKNTILNLNRFTKEVHKYILDSVC